MIAQKRVKLVSDDFCSCKLGKKYHINPLYCLSCGKFWSKNADLLKNMRKNAQIRDKERELLRKNKKKVRKEPNPDEYV